MGFFRCAPIFVFIALLALLHGLGLASPEETDQEAKELYIVYLGERQHEDADLVTASHHGMLSSILGSKERASESMVYSYKHGFSGFSAMLTQSQATKLRGLPGVLSVKMNELHATHTTRSWDFMGLPYNQPNGILASANMGEGIIIGVIDSGIWPESPSFDDEGYGPPPAKWKGICQAGRSFTSKSCNKKIIGARWYADVVNKSHLAGEFLSPRDLNGHGTHVASIAAGSIVHNVSFHGLAPGVARGGAPRAHIAVYKACWSVRAAPPAEGACSEAAVVKAMDDAIHDGVDILSVSILGGIGHLPTFHAVAKGIPVVYAGGNFGPYAQTVSNVAPWLLIVAGSQLQPWTGSSQPLSLLEMDRRSWCNLQTLANSTEVKGNIILCISSGTFLSIVQLIQLARAVMKSGGEGKSLHSKALTFLMLGSLMPCPSHVLLLIWRLLTR